MSRYDISRVASPSPASGGTPSTGCIQAVHDVVPDRRHGARVVIRMRYGAYAEAAIVAETALIALPQGFTFAEGACFHVAAATGVHAVMQRGRFVAGETLLVHGAGGGVGLAAVEVGKILGGTVIAVAGGDEKLAMARQKGADHVIDHRIGGFRERVLELTGGRGADLVFDPVGGEVFEESMRCTAWSGRLLVVGFAGGRIQSIPANLPLLKSLDIIGVQALTNAIRDPASGAAYTEWMYARAAEGRLRPHVSAALPLERFDEALALLSSRKAVGRVALTMGG